MTVNLETRHVFVHGVEAELLAAGEGRTLLFLHSGPSPDCYSSEYLTALAKDFRVIAPVHPGFGRLNRPSQFREVGDLAYFYLDMLEELDLAEVVLIGAGFGGWIASEIAVRCTGRLFALILSGPFGIKVGDRETRDFEDFLAVSPAERARLQFNHPQLRELNYAGKSEEELIVLARGREAEAFYGWEPFMHNPGLHHWLHRINIPALVLRGSDDRIVSAANHDAYVERIAGSRLELIEGAGHEPHIDQPLEFAAAVSAFIKS
jgi:pimeloyl-ACP methyl ester carboxylesterase